MPISTDFWAGERSTTPPQYTFIAPEIRKVSVNLSEAVVSGETIQGATLDAKIVNYRNELEVDPTPLVLPLAYSSSTKIAAATVNASLIPRGEPYALIFTFNVTSSAGTESRSVFVVLWREI